MADVALKIEKRIGFGKSQARRLRRTGKIPAIIYGEDQETTPLLLDRHEFEMMLKQHHTLFNLELDGKSVPSIVRDIQRHPVTGNVLHVDFLAIKKGHKLTLSVSVNYVGTAVGTKTGGIFQTNKNELNISVLPKDIPDFIEVDISNLEVGDNIRLKDISEEHIEFLDDPDDVLCSVQAPKAIEEVEEELESEEEESAEPEVITARDKDEEEKESE
ncbi:MAG TPA: 50S ribosomal protein L25 [Caldithrix sp.]|nr:50S ribosomal protein L25 [Calditrichaceae bacterium]HEM49489.1 50S ribosomal protein L25 [Caldithrix sp.]